MKTAISKSRVLCVDDEPDFLEWLSDFLQDEGFLVTSTVDPKLALDLFQRDHPIDLFICDLKMPGMNGLELITELRQISMIPVILLTGFGDFETLRESLRLGVQDFFEKPVNQDAFLAAVQRAVRLGQVLNQEDWSKSFNLSTAREALSKMKSENEKLRSELLKIKKKHAS